MSKRHGLSPLQVLERQHGFLLKWEHEQAFRTYVTGCYAPSMAWDPRDRYQPEQYVRATILSFRHGEAYRVKAEMSDLVQFAADRLDDTDKIDHTLAPTPYGFVAFEKPLPLIDARGEQMLIHYLTWGPILTTYASPLTLGVAERPGVWITMWNDPMVEADQAQRRILSTHDKIQRRYVREMGRYAFIGTEAMVDGFPVGPAVTPISEERRADMAAEDEEWLRLGLEVPPPAGLGHTNASRYVHALWLLLGQTITDVREDVMPKAAQKMAGRMPIPGKVTVISLRRRAGRKSDGEGHVEWRHRWLVRGHWRWQPYADGRVERIWIAGYAKNAHRDDLPWAQSTKIYSLDH